MSESCEELVLPFDNSDLLKKIWAKFDEEGLVATVLEACGEQHIIKFNEKK